MTFNSIQNRLIIFGLLLLYSQMGSTQGCDGPLSINLTGSSSSDSIAVEVNSDDITCASDVNGSMTLVVEGGSPIYIYSWDDVAITDSIRYNLSEGTYWVTITDQEGCSKEVSWDITQLNPDNSDLIMEDGCGSCLLSNGLSSYFFDANRKYIASLTDAAADNMAVGDTEVCVNIDNNVNSCNANPYLQRHWSVNPVSEVSSCMKLFFTQVELENLAMSIPGETVNVQSLVDNQRICVTGFSGGDENCGNFQTQTVYSTAAAPPLLLTNEDPIKGIWSVEVCTDQYATFYMHVCDYPLPVELLYFSGKEIEAGNLLEWETASELNTSHFELERSGNGMDFKLLDQIAAAGNSVVLSSYSFLDKNPLIRKNYYRLKIIDVDRTFAYSNIVLIKQDETTVSSIYPTLFNDYISYETTLEKREVLEIHIFDAIGQMAHRQYFNAIKGHQKLDINLERLPAGNYFIKITSSVSNRSEGYKVVKTAAGY